MYECYVDMFLRFQFSDVLLEKIGTSKFGHSKNHNKLTVIARSSGFVFFGDENSSKLDYISFIRLKPL